MLKQPKKRKHWNFKLIGVKMNKYDSMEYCPDCHKKMVETTVYEKYCSDIGETITVMNCEPYLTCPDGCIAHVPGEVLDDFRLKIQERIEEWIFNRIQSFDDFSKLFYTKAQALAYIKRQAKVISCNDTRFNPQVINNVIDILCFHVCICGQKFYLKKSVKKYCMYFNGLFPLFEGF